jgi:putative aminopeptidase FrvX
MIFSIPLVLSIVTNKSQGALDNASGVAAIMLAADYLVAEGVTGFGVLVTSAEELGLAGAHAWSAARAPARAINCDSVDDVGMFLCLGGGGWGGSGGHGDAVRSAVTMAATAAETPLRTRRTLTGILVDSMALDARGWDTVTICKGTLASLGRIHTAQDAPVICTGRGPAAAAILIRDASSRLLRQA